MAGQVATSVAECRRLDGGGSGPARRARGRRLHK